MTLCMTLFQKSRFSSVEMWSVTTFGGASWAVKIWRVCLTNLWNFQAKRLKRHQFYIFSPSINLYFLSLVQVFHPNFTRNFSQLSVCPWPNNHWKGKDHSPGGYQNADLQVSYKASLSPERTETSCVVQKVWSFWRLHTKMMTSNVNLMSKYQLVQHDA